MQIITIDDAIFPEVLNASKHGVLIGKFWKEDKERTIYAAGNLVIILAGENVEKIMIKNTKTQLESESIALQILKREEVRGHRIEILCG